MEVLMSQRGDTTMEKENGGARSQEGEEVGLFMLYMAFGTEFDGVHADTDCAVAGPKSRVISVPVIDAGSVLFAEQYWMKDIRGLYVAVTSS